VERRTVKHARTSRRHTHHPTATISNRKFTNRKRTDFTGKPPPLDFDGRGAYYFYETREAPMAQLSNPFGSYIKELRSERGVTVRQLADMVRKTAGYISRIEVRGEIPSAELICELADALRVPPQALMDKATKQVLQRTKQALGDRYETALALHRKTK
jgi:ribosome-binding protein aMBF1 (putative translation factor)